MVVMLFLVMVVVLAGVVDVLAAMLACSRWLSGGGLMAERSSMRPAEVMEFCVRVKVLVSAGLFAGVAQAAELQGTLKKIKDTGSITLGVRDSSIPFSYLDDKQAHQGYSIDLCMKIVSHLQKELGLSAPLKVVLNPVTSATRIPLMANGTIDLECGSTTNNIERQKQVAFAPTTFVTASRILSKKASNINSMADLKGKSVVSTTGC
jgi:glutamate/aspartate transport system substrate-binding protein